MKHVRKNISNRSDQFEISINYQNLKNENFSLYEIIFQNSQNSDKILLLLFRNKCKFNIKKCSQRDVPNDDKKRKFVFVDFVCAVHQHNFRILFQYFHRVFFNKK